MKDKNIEYNIEQKDFKTLVNGIYIDNVKINSLSLPGATLIIINEVADE